MNQREPTRYEEKHIVNYFAIPGMKRNNGAVNRIRKKYNETYDLFKHHRVCKMLGVGATIEEIMNKEELSRKAVLGIIEVNEVFRKQKYEQL